MNVTMWSEQMADLFPIASGSIGFLKARLDLLQAAGEQFPDLPAPTPQNAAASLRRVGHRACELFKGYPQAVKAIHRDCHGIKAELERAALIPVSGRAS